MPQSIANPGDEGCGRSSAGARRVRLRSGARDLFWCGSIAGAEAPNQKSRRRADEAPAPSGPDWVHEIKHDGYHLQVRRDRDAVRLFTRRLRSHRIET
jgi:ATP-dependent DNA ligase